MEKFTVHIKHLVGEKKWKSSHKTEHSSLHKALSEFGELISQEYRIRGFFNPISITVSDNYKVIYATFSIR